MFVHDSMADNSMLSQCSLGGASALIIPFLIGLKNRLRYSRQGGIRDGAGGWGYSDCCKA